MAGGGTPVRQNIRPSLRTIVIGSALDQGRFDQSPARTRSFRSRPPHKKMRPNFASRHLAGTLVVNDIESGWKKDSMTALRIAVSCGVATALALAAFAVAPRAFEAASLLAAQD